VNPNARSRAHSPQRQWEQPWANAFQAQQQGRHAYGSTAGGYDGPAMQNRSRGLSKPKPDHLKEKPAQNVDLSDLVVKKFRDLLCHRYGPNGIHKFSKCFLFIDKNHDNSVNLDELQRALNIYGLHMSDSDAHLLMTAIDTDKSGMISEAEFLAILQGPVSKVRLKLINIVFDQLDHNHDGKIEPADMAAYYNVDWDPDVKTGNVPAMTDAMTNFFKQFDGIHVDGVVSREEFLNYYKNLSASIDNDDYFELMLRNAWHISGGQGMAANTDNLRVEVEFTDGSPAKVVCIENDIGIRRGDMGAVKRRLEQQGVKNIEKVSFAG
jgi:Ca2+-binding EF-hand superfamily protein